MNDSRTTAAALLAALTLLATSGGCIEQNPLWCESDSDCADPERSFCDVGGTTPASDGIRNTCVPQPERDAGLIIDASDAPTPDAAPGPDGGPHFFTVTVVRDGTGTGTVTSSPGGITCGGTCSFAFEQGTELTLLATPDTNSELTGWSGAGCSGTGVCAFTVDADAEITATFDTLQFQLTVVTGGAGAGGVTSSPGGIDCGADCTNTYPFGTVVTLTATPGGAATFGGWSGDCAGLSPTCMVTMDAARSVGASFDEGTVTLSVSFDAAGTGGGTITSNVGAINCPGTCADSYVIDTSVTLTATPDGTSTFTGWSGDCSGTGGCSVTMSTARSVTATFTRNTHDLTVTTLGTGTGTVTSSPIGIDCGSDCTETYDEGTMVTLIAAPGATSDFTGWGGACAGAAATCDVTMSAARTVTATFDLMTHPVTVAIDSVTGGGGTVTSSPAGIDCPGDCSQSYSVGTSVTLTAAPDGDSAFVGWSGDCTGTSACMLSVDGPKNATASFKRPAVVQIAAGGSDTCALFDNGTLRCWGQNTGGKLGLGHMFKMGDDEPASMVPNVDVGDSVDAVVVGADHICALLGTDVKCWGQNATGQLGQGNSTRIGDDEFPSTIGTVPIGGPVQSVLAGNGHTCVVLTTGATRCFGSASNGALGYGNTTNIGDDEPASTGGDVPVTGTGNALSMSGGASHTCVRFTPGTVNCWGANLRGQLGYGHTDNIGDDEAPFPSTVNIGTTVQQVATALAHTCVVTTAGNVRCWGRNLDGRLGYGHTDDIGDTEFAGAGGDVDLGGLNVTQVATGAGHTCALLAGGQIKCWGAGTSGRLGYGNTDNIGDDELPSAVGTVDIGGTAVQVVAGASHTCALLDTGAVRCWGFGLLGALGYGDTESIGDDETPASAGDVPLF